MAGSTTSVAMERCEVDLTPEQRQQLLRACALAGTSLSDFLVSSALEAASELFAERRIIWVSERDWEAIMDSIENPPEPTEALRQAVAYYMGQSDDFLLDPEVANEP